MEYIESTRHVKGFSPIEQTEKTSTQSKRRSLSFMGAVSRLMSRRAADKRASSENSDFFQSQRQAVSAEKPKKFRRSLSEHALRRRSLSRGTFTPSRNTEDQLIFKEYYRESDAFREAFPSDEKFVLQCTNFIFESAGAKKQRIKPDDVTQRCKEFIFQSYYVPRIEEVVEEIKQKTDALFLKKRDIRADFLEQVIKASKDLYLRTLQPMSADAIVILAEETFRLFRDVHTVNQFTKGYSIEGYGIRPLANILKGESGEADPIYGHFYAIDGQLEIYPCFSYTEYKTLQEQISTAILQREENSSGLLTEELIVNIARQKIREYFGFRRSALRVLFPSLEKHMFEEADALLLNKSGLFFPDISKMPPFDVVRASLRSFALPDTEQPRDKKSYYLAKLRLGRDTSIEPGAMVSREAKSPVLIISRFRAEGEGIDGEKGEKGREIEGRLWLHDELEQILAIIRNLEASVRISDRKAFTTLKHDEIVSYLETLQVLFSLSNEPIDCPTRSNLDWAESPVCIALVMDLNRLAAKLDSSHSVQSFILEEESLSVDRINNENKDVNANSRSEENGNGVKKKRIYKSKSGGSPSAHRLKSAKRTNLEVFPYLPRVARCDLSNGSNRLAQLPIIRYSNPTDENYKSIDYQKTQAIGLERLQERLESEGLKLGESDLKIIGFDAQLIYTFVVRESTLSEREATTMSASILQLDALLKKIAPSPRASTKEDEKMPIIAALNSDLSELRKRAENKRLETQSIAKQGQVENPMLRYFPNLAAKGVLDQIMQKRFPSIYPPDGRRLMVKALEKIVKCLAAEEIQLKEEDIDVLVNVVSEMDRNTDRYKGNNSDSESEMPSPLPRLRMILKEINRQANGRDLSHAKAFTMDIKRLISMGRKGLWREQEKIGFL